MAKPNFVRMVVDRSKAMAKLARLQRQIEAEGSLAVEELGRLAQNYARNKAPYFSGATFRLIKLTELSGDRFVLVSQNSTAGRADGFNLPRWMHTSHRARSHIRTGDPQYMYRTSAYLRQVAPTHVAGRFNRVVVQLNKT